MKAISTADAPARATVPTGDLPKGFHLEIEAIAAVE